MRFKRVDFIFLILIIITTILSIDLLLNESHQKAIEDISKYPPFQNLYTGLIITFCVCLIGNLLPLPTPYTFIVCYSSQPFLKLNIFLYPILIGFIASLGCMIGEMGGYIVGRGTSKLLSEEKRVILNNYQKFLVEHPKTAPFLIFLFGITPLNDDMITIPLGLIRYSVKKTIFWCWLGKLGLMLIFSYNLFNICSLLGGESWLISILTLYLIIIMVYLLLKVNIMKFFKKGNIPGRK